MNGLRGQALRVLNAFDHYGFLSEGRTGAFW